MAASPNLDRFLAAQAETYAMALAEIRHGRKASHWVWYVFPQLRGLGTSPLSQHFGIAGMDEARAYLAHPVLGTRLIECVAAICDHGHSSAAQILGEIDAIKFRSCLTLFNAASTDTSAFQDALLQFFDGQPDAKTLHLLRLPALRRQVSNSKPPAS